MNVWKFSVLETTNIKYLPYQHFKRKKSCKIWDLLTDFTFTALIALFLDAVGLHGIKVCVMCVFVRASDDLKNNMVAADTMEQFQKELDQGKVSNTTQTQHKT